MEYQVFSPTISSVGGQPIPTTTALAVYAGDAREVFCQDVAAQFYADPNSSATVDGSNVITRVTGGRWLRMGGAAPGFQFQYLLEASQVLGNSALNFWWLDFINGVDDCAQVNATNGTTTILGDATDAVNSLGGVWRGSTGADVAARVNVLQPHVAGDFAPVGAFNTPSIRFYRAMRFRQISTVDANCDNWVGSDGWRMGAMGAASTTKYALKVKNSGSNFIISTVTIDTNWHIFRSYHDGTNAWFRVDAEAWQSLPDQALFPLTSATGSFWEINNGKLGAAPAHQMDIDWALWALSPT